MKNDSQSRKKFSGLFFNIRELPVFLDGARMRKVKHTHPSKGGFRALDVCGQNWNVHSLSLRLRRRLIYPSRGKNKGKFFFTTPFIFLRGMSLTLLSVFHSSLCLSLFSLSLFCLSVFHSSLCLSLFCVCLFYSEREKNENDLSPLRFLIKNGQISRLG